MRNFKYHISVALLTIVVLLLPIGSGQSWTSPVQLAFSKEEGKKTEEKKEAKKEASAPMSGTSRVATDMPYTALAEKNIFSPERKEFPYLVSPASSMKKPPPRPQVVLYGVTLAGDYQSASLVQAGRALRKGEREMFTLKVGEKIGEYELKKILPDRISLESEGDRFEVLLYDAAKPKPRTAVRTESKPAAVTSALPGPAGPSSIEPPRPGGPGVPTSERPEIPRPIVPSPVPGQERLATPPFPTTAPQTTTPSTPPVYSPGRRAPISAPPGIPAPGTTPPQAVP
ncbi:MAG: hypothetical protein FJ130_05130 [Deltaproteobacteria bacterium]|nr:hypothetical protein [Deltaproteobacteria bacterium]